MQNKCKSTPIDLNNVMIPSDLATLIEKLAENVHELWALKRISEGWTYGANRDEVNKKTPYLVPYALLSESEKDYDREVVIGILKLILKRGYIISPP